MPRPDATAHMLIRPGRRWRAIAPSHLWRFRGLLGRFAARDLTLRYRQTALGVVWVVLQPLLGAGILAFVFGRVARLSSAGRPYIAVSLAGMVAWTAFSQIVTRASTSLVANAQLVSKVAFPRLLLPIATVIAAMVDVAVSIVLLLVMAIFYDVPFGVRILALPVLLLIISTLALGIGMGCGALMVKYRDVQYVLPVALQFLLYASPVAYLLQAVPKTARGWYVLNPLTGLLEAVRWSTLGMARPATSTLCYSTAIACVMLTLGLVAFGRMEATFADAI